LTKNAFGCIIIAVQKKQGLVITSQMGESKMKKFVQSVAVLVLVSLFAVGCASTYKYENSGGTTDTVKKTPDGGYERKTSYHNRGSGPVYYRYPVSYHGGYGGAHVTPAPSAKEIQGLLPQ
jgi:hypothetical protein